MNVLTSQLSRQPLCNNHPLLHFLVTYPDCTHPLLSDIRENVVHSILALIPTLTVSRDSAPLMACTNWSSGWMSMPASVAMLLTSKPAAAKAAPAAITSPTPGIRDAPTPRTPITGARISSTSFWMNFWVMALVSKERAAMKNSTSAHCL